jgi:hypothetical protein
MIGSMLGRLSGQFITIPKNGPLVAIVSCTSQADMSFGSMADAIYIAQIVAATATAEAFSSSSNAHLSERFGGGGDSK